MKRTSFLLLVSFLAFFYPSAHSLADENPLLKSVANLPLTGGVSRFDYQSLDSQNGLLYIAHMGAGQIIVVNTRTQKVLATLSGFPGVTGVLVVPGLHRLYASVSRSHQVAVVDTQKLKILKRLPGGQFPDGMAFVPGLNQLYVSDEMGGGETVLDLVKNRRLASIKMGGEVGNTRYDPVSRLVYANVQTKNELVSIDPQTRKIVGRYPVRGGRGPHGLWIEPDARLAFLACQGDAKLVVVDLRDFKETAVFDVGREPDVLSYDSGLNILYVASEQGKASLFSVKDRQVKKLGEVEVGENAHSVQADSQTHFVYFPLRKNGKGPVLRVMRPNF